jgi:hypothetical protein
MINPGIFLEGYRKNCGKNPIFAVVFALGAEKPNQTEYFDLDRF